MPHNFKFMHLLTNFVAIMIGIKKEVLLEIPAQVKKFEKVLSRRHSFSIWYAGKSPELYIQFVKINYSNNAKTNKVYF